MQHVRESYACIQPVLDALTAAYPQHIKAFPDFQLHLSNEASLTLDWLHRRTWSTGSTICGRCSCGTPTACRWVALMMTFFHCCAAILLFLNTSNVLGVIL